MSRRRPRYRLNRGIGYWLLSLTGALIALAIVGVLRDGGARYSEWILPLVIALALLVVAVVGWVALGIKRKRAEIRRCAEQLNATGRSGVSVPLTRHRALDQALTALHTPSGDDEPHVILRIESGEMGLYRILHGRPVRFARFAAPVLEAVDVEAASQGRPGEVILSARVANDGDPVVLPLLVAPRRGLRKSTRSALPQLKLEVERAFAGTERGPSGLAGGT